MSRSPSFRRFLGVPLVALLVAGLLVTVPGLASAAATTLFSQAFLNNTADGTGAVVKPATASGAANAACLTATGGSTGVLQSCPTSTTAAPTQNDANGSGALSLTPQQTSKVGGVFAATSVPTAEGLDVSFTMHQWGSSGNPADGIAFALSAVDPASPTSPPNIGPVGGALGYSYGNGTNGLANGYLGFGFDVYGNFSNTAYQGSGCTSTANTTYARSGLTPKQVVVRGPGNKSVGYCAINGTATSSTSAAVALHATTRAGAAVPVRILINSAAHSVTTTDGLTVDTNSYLLRFTPVGASSATTLTGALPQMASTLVGSSSWLDSDGLPKQLAFGWVGSTGSLVDNHEIRNVTVKTLAAAVPQLAVAQTSYTPGASLTAGDPVGYVVNPSVSGSVTEPGPVSVTLTAPTGVKPLGASGSGWSCAAPSGQKITCTDASGPFAAGTTLPAITVTAVATGAVTATTVQTATVTTASSDTSLAGYSTSAPAGTNPATPTVTAVTPSTGSTAGGGSVTVTGANLTGATSIQIGTASEIAAGSGATLVRCSGVAAPGCFTLSGNDLVVSSWPAHAAGAVVVKVVALGSSATGSYTFATVPAAPAVTATTGVTSATATWTAPANGGSAITGYTVRVYKDGTLQSGLTYAATSATTSHTFTGLTAGSSYTFTVTASNTYGAGDVGTSTAVVPYTVPTAPLTPTAVAGSGQAAVSWLAPSSDGANAITGYVVTPIRNGVAQTPVVFTATDRTQTITGLDAGASYTFTVAATNAAGTGPASAVTSAVTINAAPSLNLATPPAGEVGASYSIPAFVATGGTGPFSWDVSTGALPAGLNLSSAGVISGTPTAAGTASFTVRVTDASGKTATQALTLTVAPAPSLANPAPAAGEVTVPYGNQLTVTGGTGPFTWSAAGGLPPGVTLTTTGLLSGTPTTAGTYSFTVTVTDAFAQTASQLLSVTIAAVPQISVQTVPGGEVGVAYSETMTATGGTAPLTWSAPGDPLPPGLTLNPATGAITGTPATAGTFPVTIRVVDARNVAATKAFSIVIADRPAASLTPPAGEVGAAYTASTPVTGGIGPFTYQVTGGTLPPGLTLNPSTGVISGTPTAAGSSPITVTVTDAAGVTATASGTIVVSPAPILTIPTLPRADVGTTYQQQLSVIGGTGPFTWSVASGRLPSGLTLDAATGRISGTPTTGETTTATVRVVDAFGQATQADATVVVRVPTTTILTASTPTLSPNQQVTLTATVAPTAASGTVTFSATATSGPRAGETFFLGIGTLVNGSATATLTTSFPALGAYDVVAGYTGNSGYSGSASAVVPLKVAATAGSVLVTEFRLSGPTGAADDYVEMTNVSGAPVPLAGVQVQTASGGAATIPTSAAPLPVGRSYLVAGSGYSLSAVAPADTTASGDMGSGGVRLVAPDPDSTVLDAVGANAAGFFQGQALPAFTGQPTDQYGWVRTQQIGVLKNTQSNAADFALVSTSGGTVGGLQSMLGSPSPTSLTTPWDRSSVVSSTLLDTGLAATVAPNRVTTRQPGAAGGKVETRRVITNSTGERIAALQVRLIDLSEANGLAPVMVPLTTTKASMRATVPAAPTVSVTVDGTPVTVHNLAPAGPSAAAPGGGLNSTFPIPLPEGGLAPGQSITVALTFTADSSGTFWFRYSTEATFGGG